jgi:alkylhydroperoxidase family enzyme
VWWECNFFDEAEQAAFRWAETLTNISQSHAPDALYEALTPHFSEQQIVDLTMIVAAMNAWNRIAVGHHNRPLRRQEQS